MNEQQYIEQIKELQNPTFQQIRHIAIDSISHLSQDEIDKLYERLNHGVDILKTHEELCQYLWSFGNMHESKIHFAVDKLPPGLLQSEYDIVDWGCGQGLATICFFDYLKENNFDNNIKNVKLIEPGLPALDRARLHLEQYIDKNKIQTINKIFEDVDVNEIITIGRPTIHLFSNILDIEEIDLKELAEKLNKSLTTDNYVVIVGPTNATNERIDWFYNQYFTNTKIICNKEDRNFRNKWTLKAKIFKLIYNKQSVFVPIEFYPAVQFHSAYQLDVIKSYLQQTNNEIKIKYKKLAGFETYAPFDIGANVYDDVHPVYAVLNNIITRGLPTKASPLIEEIFENTYKFSSESIEDGDITYQVKKQINIDKYLDIDSIDITKLTNEEKIEIEHIFSTVLISRIQKVIIEALITGKLKLKDSWKILVEEKDIPGTVLAIRDLKQLFNNLCMLSKDYKDLKFPKVELTLIGNEYFKKSVLHLGQKVYLNPNNDILQKEYDLVLDVAFFEFSNINKDSFSRYKVLNKCYFNIRSTNIINTKRNVYTTDRIVYRNIVSYNAQGRIKELKEAKKILTYFLQLLFRKVEFRPGQLPILHRALQNKAVIGLLPTGGGKSLTYQLAAMLQPGVTIIVDPLKSLMKDQYDALLNFGIDNCAFINSSMEPDEKVKVEEELEQSRLLFIFLSPERLAIYEFRERLKNMEQLNVYFSYGVIDEVHCVSEWGHDFRFSYLHLGRNLYNYVKPKTGHVSLFGLTATASFDVLADVERELSGNGAFPLDAETVVRHENTNRLELQYKIEKINVELKKDSYFDKNNILARKLPKAVKISDNWSFFKSKREFLFNYLKQIPKYIRELQNRENVEKIKKEFIERLNLQENNEQDRIEVEAIRSAELSIKMPDDFYVDKQDYKQAGIVFCPHKNNTGISVNENVNNLKSFVPDVGKFYGGNDDFMDELEHFQNNRKPLMVATKAFGMGIDKPNVRLTINMNYSSSLESFVQEAGRAGRDRKMALAVILISDYKLVRINPNAPYDGFPFTEKENKKYLIKGKWFKPEDLQTILRHYNITVDKKYLDYLTPEKDLVRITCNDGNEKKYFGFNQCKDYKCPVFKECLLKKLPREAENWQYEKDLNEILKKENLNIPKKYFEYQNADYDTVIYFYNNNFKGAPIEKQNIVEILNKIPIEAFYGNDGEKKKTFQINGFLETLTNVGINEKIVSFVKYNDENYPDISKAIYRMTSIGLIEDFTQDYKNSQFRIVSTRYKESYYFKQLQNYLERYYSKERADQELNKAKNWKIKETKSELRNEIYRCLGYLTYFVYDKISVKRKRAIDDMRNFCLVGIDENKDWKDTNETLKDFIYYYFNSKYAQSDYIADNGEPYSLTEDTEGGKISNSDILFKYLKVVEPEIVGTGTEIDNIKHLQGAVRLIRRSLTDDNPTISLLNAFCLMFLGTKNNENLERELENSYKEGMIEFYSRLEDKTIFINKILDSYNRIILNNTTFEQKKLDEFRQDILLDIHLNEFYKINKRYLDKWT